DRDMVGVSDVISDFGIRLAVERGYPVDAANAEAADAMGSENIPVAGLLEDLLAEVDVIVDCTPKKIGAQNRTVYQQHGVKSIWQGGEKHDVAGYSFVAQGTYAGAVGRDSARVAPGHPPAPSRISHALHRHGGVTRGRAVRF